MIYRSNLTCPDLSPHFKHLVSSPMAHSFGHDVPRDWGDKSDDDPVFGIWKRCGFWTHDEAAILYNVAKSVNGFWLDVGSHTGWTSVYAMAAGRLVTSVDQMLALEEFARRFESNTFGFWGNLDAYWSKKSDGFFESYDAWMDGCQMSGVCIDGDHDAPQPLRDAQNAAAHLANTGVIMLHDFNGRPVQEAVEWLMGQGFKARIYFTPAMVACCWKGEFVPPDHVPDPNLPDLKARCANFNFERCV